MSFLPALPPFPKYPDLLQILFDAKGSNRDYLFLQTSYNKLHFCSHACFNPIVSGQSHSQDICSALHLIRVHEQHNINRANTMAIASAFKKFLFILIPPLGLYYCFSNPLICHPLPHA